jgi:hypothetical protein
MCGICAALYITSCSRRGSQWQTTPRPSMGAMLCRAVRTWRRTTMGAFALMAVRSPFTSVCRKTLSPHSSCTSAGGVALRAASMSTTAGRSSICSSTRAAMSSAWARVGATHMAMVSPTWRTLPRASGHWSEALKPANAEMARIGLTPARSSIVNTAPSWPGGLVIGPSRPCATGERTKATSSMPGRRMSPTNWPRPAR